MKLLSFLIRHSPWRLSVAVLTGIISGAASAVLMASVNRALSDDGAAAADIRWVFLGAMLTVLVAGLSSRLLLLSMSTKAVTRMRLNLCQQILLSPLRQVENHGSSTLLAALTEDVLAVSDTLAEFPMACISMTVITACLVYLSWLSWPLTALFLVAVILGTLVHELIARQTRSYLAQGRDKWDELIHHYNSLILGNKELKLHSNRRHAFIEETLRPTAESMQRLAYTWHKIFAIAGSYGQVFYFILIGAILFVAPVFGRFDAAVLTGFTLLTVYMVGPISFIVGSLPRFQRAGVSLDKIESLGLSLASTGPSDLSPAAADPAAVFTAIEARDVCHAYYDEADERGFTIGPINLRLVPGETVFIIGGNGSGKSSFAKILTGLYTPTSGTLLLNGQPVTDSNRDAYRQNFTAIFSDFHLFRSMLGLIGEDLIERVDFFLEKLQLSHKVKLEGHKLSTLALSQGQRKRLALLVAFLEDRHIYLFDEWAADQDPSFKEVFYRSILRDLKARGKTVIVVSHDQHFYHVADRLIRFEEGVIVEDVRPRPPQPAAGTSMIDALDESEV